MITQLHTVPPSEETLGEDLVSFLPWRRRFLRKAFPGAIIDPEIVSVAHLFAKGAAGFFVLGFVCRVVWQVL